MDEEMNGDNNVQRKSINRVQRFTHASLNPRRDLQSSDK